MTLELEKLSEPIQRMAQGAAKRREQENVLLDALMQKLHENRTAWERIEKAMDTAVNTLDMKWYRGARPLNHVEPLDAAIDVGQPPGHAGGLRWLADRAQSPRRFSLLCDQRGHYRL